MPELDGDERDLLAAMIEEQLDHYDDDEPGLVSARSADNATLRALLERMQGSEPLSATDMALLAEERSDWLDRLHASDEIGEVTYNAVAAIDLPASPDESVEL